MDFDQIPDIEDLDQSLERQCVVNYNNLTFGVKFRGGLIGPQTVMMFEHLQDVAKESERVRKAQERLETRAKEIETRDGIDSLAAMDKARRINPDLVESLEPRIKADMASTSKELNRLISYIGLKAGGQLIPPSYEFFLGRSFDFHLAILLAVMDENARPTSVSLTESSTGSPATYMSGQESTTPTAPPDTSLIEPQDSKAEALTIS